jgi:tetratricopeptide (TPR) repeat protein
VWEQEEVKLGHQFLTRYQFAHTLFQQYLYNNLGTGERRALHGQIATLLEELYQGHTERIAVQLARHYLEAGKDDKAVDYLIQAGDAASRLYAYDEARLHYTRALETLARLPDTVENRRRRVDTLTKRVACSWTADPAEENLERLAEAERLLGGLGGPDEMPGSDQVRLARVHYWIGRIHYRGIRMPDAIAYYRQVLPVAQEIGDPELLGLPSAAIGQALVVQGRNGQAEPLLRQAMTALQQVGNRSAWLHTLAFHGFVIALMGDYVLGMAELQRGVAGAQELGHVTLAATVRLAPVVLYGLAGELPQAMETAHKAVEAAEESGDQILIYLSHGYQAWAEAQAGLFEAAEASMGRAQSVAKVLGGQLVFADWFLAIRARIALGAGRIQEALELVERAVATAQEVDNLVTEAYARQIWGQALAELKPPRWNEAEAQFVEAMRLFESGQAGLWAARACTAWGSVCRERGDLAAAREHWEKAAALWRASDITWELEKVRTLIETLPEA